MKQYVKIGVWLLGAFLIGILLIRITGKEGSPPPAGASSAPAEGAPAVTRPAWKVGYVLAPVTGRSEEIRIDNPLKFCIYPEEEVDGFQRDKNGEKSFVAGPGKIPNLGKLEEATMFTYRSRVGHPVRVNYNKDCFS